MARIGSRSGLVVGAARTPALVLRVAAPRDEDSHDDADRALGRVASSLRVAEENRRAASFARGLAMDDARRLFAARVADSLEGGRAAILRPNRRRELVAAAIHMGLRPFDANLVVAIVQDAARTGDGALGDDAMSRLELVRAPRHRKVRTLVVRAALVIGLAAIVAVALVRAVLSAR